MEQQPQARLGRPVTALVVWLAFLFPALALPAQLAAQDVDRSRTAAPEELRRKAGQGEQCLVCGEQIRGGEVVELRYKGRRFYVAEPLLAELLDEPDRYFGSLQARSALFDENAWVASGSPGWMYFGIYVLVGLISGAVCGYLAISRSLSPLPWFFAGLLGNVAALVVLLATGRGVSAGIAVPPGLAKVPTTHAPVACGGCGALNHPSAAACAKCGKHVDPAFTSEVSRVRQGGTW